MGNFLENCRMVGLHSALYEVILYAKYDIETAFSDLECKCMLKQAEMLKESREKKEKREAEKAAKKAEKEEEKTALKAAKEAENEKSKQTSKKTEKEDDNSFDDNITAENEIKEIKIREISSDEPANEEPAAAADDDLDIIISKAGTENISQAEMANIMLGCQSMYSNIDYNLIKVVTSSMLYASTHICSEDLFQAIGKSEDNMLLANSLVHVWTGVSINPGFECVDDPVDLLKNPMDLTSIAGYVATKLSGSALIQNIADRCRTMVTENDRKRQELMGVKDPDPIVPIMFINNPIKQQTEDIHLTNAEKKALKKKFRGLLDGKDYQFNKLKDMYELVVSDQVFGRRVYLIDRYSFENDLNVLVTINHSWYPISLDTESDIIKKILDNPAYVITEQEMQRIISRINFSAVVYANIDMSNIAEIKRRIVASGKPGDDKRFNEKLVRILDVQWQMHFGIDIPRLRISEFNSVDDFTLVSDDKVKLPALAGFNNNLLPISIKVAGDNLYASYGDLNATIELK